jgi:adenylosuccinate synthase
MPVTAVLGAQWGDEGKGKIVDNLCQHADVVARFQGGANAGHTLFVSGKETILHQLPSGILHEKVECILGNGMVVDPPELWREMQALQSQGLRLTERVHISLQAQVVTPIHKLLDAKTELALGSAAIGTTKRGIGPCYTDKINRSGIQVRELRDIASIRQKLNEKIEQLRHNKLATEEEIQSLIKAFDQFYSAATEILPYTTDTSRLLNHYIRAGKNILVEGAQGTLLDVDFGSFPYVTSSNTIAGNICTGLGIGPKTIDNIIGVYKSYTTRVGAGPFPTEQLNATGEYLQQTGMEFGATTHRKRRCGWFDAALGQYSARINGFTAAIITKLDILDQLDQIQICTHYENGSFPEIDLQSAQPHYISLPGWHKTTSNLHQFSNLPKAAQQYLRKIEELLEIPISHVSVGKERRQLICLES